MKKTLTVNLGGTVYHIDEDAYVLLDNYLNNLRYYFRREEGAEEIVRDIENRIGELFDEYLRNGQQVITVENVEAVIGRTVTDSFERVNDYVRSDKPRSILHRIGSGIVQMVGLLMRLVLILIAICLAPVLFAGIVTVFALIMAATGILISVPAFVYNAFPYINWELVASSSGMAVGLAVCLLLVVCIPFIGLLQLIFQGLKIWGPMSTTAKVVWVILWFVALGAGIILFIQAPYLNYPYHFLL